MDSTTHDMLAAAIDNLAPGVRERLEREARELYEEARAGWPVKTGRSRDALQWGVRIPDDDSIESHVGVDPKSDAVEYFHLIKGRKHRGKQTWRVLLQRPAQERARKLGEDLKDVLMNILTRRGYRG